MSTTPPPSPLQFPLRLSCYAITLLALDVWRESRGQSSAWPGVLWCVLNRARHPQWWGNDVISVITHKWQFSSMTAPGDPNTVQWPAASDPQFLAIVDLIAKWEVGTVPDPTNGATYYYSRPLTAPPAAWGDVQETAVINGIHFCRPTC